MAISILQHGRSKFFQLRTINPFLSKLNFLGAGNLKTLSVLGY
jgi:hypothetical protein